MDLPPEIWTIIDSFLEPIDSISLSRTSKRLRCLFEYNHPCIAQERQDIFNNKDIVQGRKYGAYIGGYVLLDVHYGNGSHSCHRGYCDENGRNGLWKQTINDRVYLPLEHCLYRNGRAWLGNLVSFDGRNFITYSLINGIQNQIALCNFEQKQVNVSTNRIEYIYLKKKLTETYSEVDIVTYEDRSIERIRINYRCPGCFGFQRFNIRWDKDQRKYISDNPLIDSRSIYISLEALNLKLCHSCSFQGNLQLVEN